MSRIIRFSSALRRPRASAELARLERAGATLLPDGPKHIHRMEIKSSSSSNKYIVAQSKTSGEWQCSCRGWIGWRKCKHIQSMLPLLLQAFGGHEATPKLSGTSAGETPPKKAVKSRLPAGEAERRAEARRKATWEGKNYKTYNPDVEGYGSPEDWAAFAEEIGAGRGKFKFNAEPIPRQMKDLDWFDLSAMPGTFAGLKSAFRQACKKYHPDQGGSASDFKAMFEAFKRLSKSY